MNECWTMNRDYERTMNDEMGLWTMNRDYEWWNGTMNERWTMNRADERWIGIMNEQTNDRMIGWTNDRNFGSITAEQRLFGQTNGRTIERSDERTNEPWTIERTIKRSDERTNKLRIGGWTIEWTTERSLCLCCACVGVWGGEVSCHEMAWVA
jgi:hypothetical protein